VIKSCHTRKKNSNEQFVKVLQKVSNETETVYFRFHRILRHVIDVPVSTGFLKRSGFVNYIPKGVEIGYMAPYSADVEFGRGGKPIEGTQEIEIKQHYRKTPKGMVPVKAHTKKYVDKKIIRFRPKHSKFEYGPPIFRVISEEHATKPQLFLTRAKEKGLQDLGTDIMFHVKRLENK